MASSENSHSTEKTSSFSRSYSFISDDPPKENAKTKKLREVINPIFIECMKYTDDSMWLDKLDSAARGRFPTNSTYKDGYLIYYGKSDKKEVKVPKNREKAFHVFHKFMGDYFDIRSDRDESMATFALNNYSSAPKIGKIEKHNEFLRLIFQYVDKYAAENKLNPEQRANFIRVINYGINIGIFNEKAVHYDIDEETGMKCVKSIDHLIIKESTYRYPYIEPKYLLKVENAILKKIDCDDTSTTLHIAYRSDVPPKKKLKKDVTFAMISEAFARLSQEDDFITLG